MFCGYVFSLYSICVEPPSGIQTEKRILGFSPDFAHLQISAIFAHSVQFPIDEFMSGRGEFERENTAFKITLFQQ